MIALVDYGAGNLQSVANALTHVGATFQVTDDAAQVASADKVVFPGVGAAASCMRALRSRGLEEAIRQHRAPVLGICLGMQVLTRFSTEGVDEVPCLAVLPGETSRLTGELKLPQIGWNSVTLRSEDPLFEGLNSGEHFYFLHSYRVRTEKRYVLAETDYGGAFPSAVRRENFWGVQFHPEKSGPAGLRLLRNFIELC
jgi:glutamine amidotransferase